MKAVVEAAEFLRDAGTQRYLAQVGREAGCCLAVALESEPVLAVFERLHGVAGEPILIAVPRRERDGWGLVFLSLDQIAPEQFTEDTTVGAAYDAIVG